ncbi:glutamine amidotransferase [Sinomonas sp. ASV322]|uniref:glutamine amidotransferase n=1 Tax=Sinomonas sp. ASV322 TaxID=3041920 RepID=UPI0027DCF130|nr:glutamine amidotransferase [Sinomonas sp. ASV322]MDQ4503953.1 glutamine amidotransferase [Sinomonas sp. ASV322]
MRPFLLLASRDHDVVADDEYRAFCEYGGLAPAELRRVRAEAGPLPDIRLEDYSGVILGGSPFTASDPEDQKSAVQLRVEAEIGALLDGIVAADFPFLGACYGVGLLGTHEGAVVDRRFGEPIGAVKVRLTPAGLLDPLCAGLEEVFEAYVGHKEAVRTLPSSAALLAGSATCPVHMFRFRRNLYATQFHPELDLRGIEHRVEAYRHSGYFPPEEAEAVMERARGAHVHEPHRILRNFVERYAR